VDAFDPDIAPHDFVAIGLAFQPTARKARIFFAESDSRRESHHRGIW
jgi:hypothetical protein